MSHRVCGPRLLRFRTIHQPDPGWAVAFGATHTRKSVGLVPYLSMLLSCSSDPQKGGGVSLSLHHIARTSGG